MIGVIIIGFRRAVFSNEAGLGSAAIAHATARTRYPVREGYVALLEPFIDTVVVCTMTALVIIITGNYMDIGGMSGVDLTSKAFASVIRTVRARTDKHVGNNHVRIRQMKKQK